MTNSIRPEDIIYFWFTECSEQDWFKKSLAFDDLLRRRFGDVHAQAARGELSHWRNRPNGRLAEIIVLDQFSRNIYRGKPQSFATDMQSLTLAQEMIRAGDDLKLETLKQRVFAYMPFMHSESLKIQEEGIELFKEIGIEDNIRYMIAHRDVIAKYGRFPHRNAILGRKSSDAEIEFVNAGGGF